MFWDFNLLSLQNEHLARLLLITRLATGKQFLTLRSVDDDTKPLASLSDDPNGNCATIGGEAVINYRDYG